MVKKSKRSVFLSLENILIFSFFIFMIGALFLKGLHFRELFIPSFIIISLMFVLLLYNMICKNDFRMISNFVDLSILGLLAAYYISFLFGVSKMDSFDGLLKYISYFMIYKLMNKLSSNQKNLKLILELFVGFGLVLSVTSLLAYHGILNNPGAVTYGQRLGGMLQYANATASLSGAFLFLCVSLLIKENNRYLGAFYTLTGLLSFYTLLLTKSRGALLIFAIVWILAVILYKKTARLHFAAYSLIEILLGVIVYGIFTQSNSPMGFMLLLLLMSTLTVLLNIIQRHLKLAMERLDSGIYKRYIIGFLTIAGFIIFAIFSLKEPLTLYESNSQIKYEIYDIKSGMEYDLRFTTENLTEAEQPYLVNVNYSDKHNSIKSIAKKDFVADTKQTETLDFTAPTDSNYLILSFGLKGTLNGIKIHDISLVEKLSGKTIYTAGFSYRFLPDDLMNKLQGINLKTGTADERLTMYKDGLKAFVDHPIVGTGAGGWSNIYTQYRSYKYNAVDIHNFYLQTAIETGIFGVAALISLLIVLCLIFIRLYGVSKDKYNELIGVALCLAMLLLHGFIDFNLSIYLVAIILWALIGVMAGMSDMLGICIIKLGKVPGLIANTAAFIVCIVFTVLSVVMTSGIYQGVQGARLAAVNPEEASKYYANAAKMDFYNVEYTLDYCQLIINHTTNKKSEINGYIYDKFEEVKRHEPYKTIYWRTILEFYIGNNYLEDALTLLDEMITIDPLETKFYEYYIGVHYQVLQKLSNEANINSAQEIKNKILDAERRYNNVVDRLPDQDRLDEQTISIIQEIKGL